MADRDLNDARYGATTTTTTGTTGADTDLRRLSELDDFEVADGHPDIRGWKVKTPDGQVLGKVDDLIVSVREMRVRYIDVDVDRSVKSGLADAATPKGAEAGHALVPIGTATLDDAGDDVIVRSLTGADLASYPLYARQGGITRDYEQSLRSRFGGSATTGAAAGAAAASSDFYAGEHYDESRLFDRSRGRTGTTGATGTTGTSGVNAASTSGASTSGASTSGSLGESARDIPTSRESTGAQGSSFQRDNVIVRRGAGTSGTAGTVGASGATSGAADRATSSGFADRVTDKIDDLKDRVDGNPASRPGPDATDSRI